MNATTEYNKLMETLSNLVKMKLFEELGGYDMVLPSAERWIDDQEGDTPENVEEVRYFLDAKDPGYGGLYTVRGVKIMQTLGNCYLNDLVDWLNQNFKFAISKNGLLTVLSNEHPNVIIANIDYDFSETFLDNLMNLCHEAVEKLSEYVSEDDFNDEVAEVSQNTEENGKKFGFI